MGTRFVGMIFHCHLGFSQFNAKQLIIDRKQELNLYATPNRQGDGGGAEITDD